MPNYALLFPISCLTNLPLPTSIIVYAAYMLNYEVMSPQKGIDMDDTGALEELYIRSMAMFYYLTAKPLEWQGVGRDTA